jgi:hypothetical protein
VLDKAEVIPMELLGLHVGQTVAVLVSVVAVCTRTVFGSNTVVNDAAEAVLMVLLY